MSGVGPEAHEGWEPEPEPMVLGETFVQPESPWLWHVELYLMSKYAPEFVDTTIFKVRSAALERAKIVKEDHGIHRSVISLQNAIESDLAHHVTWSPTKAHRPSSKTPSPGIGRSYQQDLDRL